MLYTLVMFSAFYQGVCGLVTMNSEMKFFEDLFPLNKITLKTITGISHSYGAPYFYNS